MTRVMATEYVIRSRKERVWLMEYPSSHSLHKLRWCWTLEWDHATRYQTEELAEAKAKEFDLKDFSIESRKVSNL